MLFGAVAAAITMLILARMGPVARAVLWLVAAAGTLCALVLLLAAVAEVSVEAAFWLGGLAAAVVLLGWLVLGLF